MSCADHDLIRPTWLAYEGGFFQKKETIMPFISHCLSEGSWVKTARLVWVGLELPDSGVDNITIDIRDNLVRSIDSRNSEVG